MSRIAPKIKVIVKDDSAHTPLIEITLGRAKTRLYTCEAREMAMTLLEFSGNAEMYQVLLEPMGRFSTDHKNKFLRTVMRNVKKQRNLCRDSKS